MQYRKIIYSLLYVKGILWIILTLVYIAREVNFIPFIVLFDGAIHIMLGHLTRKHGKRLYAVILLVIIGNTVLTVMDRIGIWDLAALIIYPVIAICMYLDQKK